MFEAKLSRKEKPAWKALVDVTECFIGSYRAENYQDIVSNLLQKYKAMGCRMSLTLQFLHSHLDFFPPYLADVSDEHGEKCHQDISLMEMRYQDKFIPSMMGDYGWFIQRETGSSHKRKSRCLKYF